jgi:glycosyltransferase involved in cell wall biosynthesis
MKIIFFANTDWYLFNFRLPLAHWLRARGHEILFLSPPGDYCERLRAAGFRWEPLPMDRRSLNPWREWRLLNHIRRLYARERPDLVHHFTIKSVVYGSLAARTLGIRRRVNAVTGLGHVFTDSGLKARALRPLVRALLRLALGGAGSRLILQNPDDERAFRTAGLIDPERIRLIRGSGVDTTRFQPVARTTDPHPLRVLLATRLLWEKGVGEYVAAARVLRASGMAIECLLAGEPDPGNPAAIPEDQLERWRAEGNVVLLGHVDDMPALLERVDIAVLPTSYGEGVPRSLLEAAACGLPLIATDVPGCREIVRDDENGLLIPARDSAALTAAIRRLSQDAALRARFGAASRARVLDDFDQTLVFERTLEVYRELEAMDRHR